MKKIKMTDENVADFIEKINTMFTDESIVPTFVENIILNFKNHSFNFVNIYCNNEVSEIISNIVSYLKYSYFKYKPYIESFDESGNIKVEIGEIKKFKFDNYTQNFSENEISPLTTAIYIDTPSNKNKFTNNYEGKSDETRNTPNYSEKYYEVIYKYPTLYSIILTWLKPVIYELNQIY